MSNQADPGEEQTKVDAAMPGRRLALRLDRVTKLDGRKIILHDLSARFHTGELTAIIGPRGSGKSLLARVIAGQRVPDAGRVIVSRPPAPQIAAGWALHTAGSMERGLGIIASAYGIDTKAYVNAVASLLDDPRVLSRTYKEVPGAERSLITYACSYLVPSEVYLGDGTLLPNQPQLRARLEPMFDAVRARAAIILTSHDPLVARRADADRVAMLWRGKLRFYDDVDALTEAFVAVAGLPTVSEGMP